MELAGVGGLSDKIREIITRVQGTVDGAIDRVIDWIVAQANRLFRGNREDNRNQQNPQQDAQVTRGLEAISAQERPFLTSGKITEQEAQQVASNVKSQHPVFRELRVVDGGDSWDYQYDAGERNRGRKGTAINQTPEGGRVIQRANKEQDEIDNFRKGNELPEYDQNDAQTGTVAHLTIEDNKFYGTNSGLKKTYSLTIEERREWFQKLILNGRLIDSKTSKQLKNLSEAQFLSHAEAETLIKAKKSGLPLPNELNLFVDRTTCPNCSQFLGDLLSELGISKLNIYWRNAKNAPKVILAK